MNARATLQPKSLLKEAHLLAHELSRLQPAFRFSRSPGVDARAGRRKRLACPSRDRRRERSPGAVTARSRQGAVRPTRRGAGRLRLRVRARVRIPARAPPEGAARSRARQGRQRPVRSPSRPLSRRAGAGSRAGRARRRRASGSIPGAGGSCGRRSPGRGAAPALAQQQQPGDEIIVTGRGLRARVRPGRMPSSTPMPPATAAMISSGLAVTMRRLRRKLAKAIIIDRAPAETRSVIDRIADTGDLALEPIVLVM